MRTVGYSAFALLVLPLAVLVGAQGIKKWKGPPGEGEAAPAKPPKTPKFLKAALEQEVPFETVEALKAANKAAKAFAKFDRDGDELLDESELPPKWRADALRFDRDRDGKLSPTELADYLEAVEEEKKAKKAQKAAGGQAMAPQAMAVQAKPRQPVYRPGRLPAGLPPWFAELDADNDGQVGLYEWRTAGRDADEFLKLDLNEDGFVTAEEALRAQRARR
jgi:hypothetical protein